MRRDDDASPCGIYDQRPAIDRSSLPHRKARVLSTVESFTKHSGDTVAVDALSSSVPSREIQGPLHVVVIVRGKGTVAISRH